MTEGIKSTTTVGKDEDGEVDFAEDERVEDQREAAQEGPLEEEAKKDFVEEGKGPE